MKRPDCMQAARAFSFREGEMGYAIPAIETNLQIEEREKKEAVRATEIKNIAAQANEPLKVSLQGKIRSDWELARNDKRVTQQKMIDNLLQKRGEYDVQKLAQIKELGSDIFMLITDVKCRTALAMLREIYANPAEKPWAIEPTPVPKLSPQMEKLAEMTFMKQVEKLLEQLMMDPTRQGELEEEVISEALPKFKKEFKSIQKEIADEKAQMMMAKMDDQLVEGGYYKALLSCLNDIVTLKAGFVKGPIYRKRKYLDIEQDPITGKGRRVVREEIRPEWDSPSPFDIFPLPGVTDVNKGGLIELLKYTRTDLQGMIGLGGFDEVAIREVLNNFAQKGLHQWTWDADEIERAEAEGKETSQYYDWDTIDCLEYHNAIHGRFILEWAGIEVPEGAKSASFMGHEIDPDFDYQCTAWLIDRWILKISINENPLGKKIYYKASYVSEKNSFWGRGLPETMKDGQQIANSVMRALQNNVGIASGPQVGIDNESLAPGVNPDRMWPWKIWKFARQVFSSRTEPFMQFFQPQMHVQELIQAYDRASKICDEHSAIAGFTHGDRNIQGAGNTVSGFALFAGMQNRGIKDVALEIDMEIVQPSLEDLYYENYALDESLDYIGDIKVRARGSAYVLMKETQAIRRNDFLRATANPTDAQIMGLDGRRESLYETAKDLFPYPNKIVPPADLVKPIPQPAVPGAPGAPKFPNAPGPTTLDQAGLPAQGTENNMFAPAPNTGGPAPIGGENG